MEISTDEDPSLRIESSAIVNLRGVSTKLCFNLIFPMQTYKELRMFRAWNRYIGKDGHGHADTDRRTVFADSFLRTVSCGQFLADSFLRTVSCGQFLADSFLRTVFCGQFFADSFLRTVFCGQFFCGQFFADSFLNTFFLIFLYFSSILKGLFSLTGTVSTSPNLAKARARRASKA